MGSLTWAFRDGRRSFIAGGEVANAITPADTKIAPAHNDAPARGASALARTVAERTMALKRIVVKAKFSRTLDLCINQNFSAPYTAPPSGSPS